MKELSKHDLGNRITALRKLKGFSQEDLANAIAISRPSLAQVELGNRNVDVFEMKKITEVLGCSMDEIISSNFSILEEPTMEYAVKKSVPSIRIDTAKFNFEKFKHVFLYLLEKTAGKININEPSIFNLLYFADFDYYEQYETHLSSILYKKLGNQIIAENGDQIIKSLIENESVLRIKTKSSILNKKIQFRLIPLEKADLTKIKASEKETIDHVFELMANWSASALADYANGDLPFITTKEGKIIKYELAFYRESPYSVRVYQNND